MISKGESLALIILLVAGCTAYTSVPSFVPPVEWSQKYGGNRIEIAYFAQQTNDGGYILVGGVTNWTVGVPSYDDVWLVKTDSVGKMQWNQTYGGKWDDSGRCVQQTTDGGYVIAGSTNSSGVGKADFWLIKTDPSGNMQWNRTYGGADYDFAGFVQQTSDGGYIVAGDTLSFGAGGADVWLIKTDPSGNMLWNKTYGGLNWEWTASVLENADGGYFIAGNKAGYPTAITDFWLIKTDANGNMLWNRTYGGPEDNVAYSGQQTTDGGYVAAGMTWSYGAGQDDYWLVKTDSDGNHEWNRTYGSADHEIGYSVHQTYDKGYVLTGTQSGTYGEHCLLVKTDENGTEQWNAVIGDPQDAYSRATALCGQQTREGGYVVAGFAYSVIPNTSTATSDFWVSKIAATYSLVTPTVFGASSVVLLLAAITYFVLRDRRLRKQEAFDSMEH